MPEFILRIKQSKIVDSDIVYALREAAKDIEKVFDLTDKHNQPIPPNHYPVRNNQGEKIGYFEVVI